MKPRSWRLRFWLRTSLVLLLAAGCAAMGLPASASRPPDSSEAVEILNAVCPRRHVIINQALPGRFSGCTPCPSFTSWGHLRIKGQFNLEAVIFGSFSGPGVQEAVATFNGCVDHADAPDFMSSIVLVKRNNAWQMEVDGYQQGNDASKCKAFTLQDGRQVLVCQDFEGHPDVSYQGIYWWDFKAEKPMRELVTTINTWGACDDHALEESISGYHIQRFSGLTGVRVNINVARLKHYGNMGVCAGEYHGPKPSRYHLDFLFKNSDFVVAPWSASRKRLLDKLFSSARN